jgi:hypothetical protein
VSGCGNRATNATQEVHVLFLFGNGIEGDVVVHLHGCRAVRDAAPTDPRPGSSREIDGASVQSADRVGAVQRALDKLA